MDSNRNNVRQGESERADEYRPPTLTLIGNIQEVVLGVPGYAWDHNGYSEPIFEFQPDGEEA
jgi:hypothetical protein